MVSMPPALVIVCYLGVGCFAGHGGMTRRTAEDEATTLRREGAGGSRPQ
jgi:predicted aminopeptidase